MSLILCTIYAQSQDYIIHDNSLLIPDVPTPFLQTNPYPLGTTTPCKLEVGKSFNSMSYRAIFYGGNIGVSQSTSTFGNYLGKWSFTGAWQKKTLSGLPVQYTFIPGINYLVNYHRWGDYAAHFGLRATSTTRNDSYPEGISYTEAPQKDAVITWAYETGATPNRLIFQTIEGVDTTVPKPEDVEHEWATILSNGNIGSGTSNPTAQFQIKPINNPSVPLSMEILDNNGNSKLTFSKTGKLGIGVFSPSAYLDINGDVIIKPNSGSNSADKNILIKDANGNEKIFVTADGKLFLPGIAGSSDRVLYISPAPIGEVYTSLTSPNLIDAWQIQGNNLPTNPGLNTFGSITNHDIEFIAGNVRSFRMFGINSTERGFIDYYKPISMGGDFGSSVFTAHENWTLKIKSKGATGISFPNFVDPPTKGAINISDINGNTIFGVSDDQIYIKPRTLFKSSINTEGDVQIGLSTSIPNNLFVTGNLTVPDAGISYLNTYQIVSDKILPNSGGLAGTSTIGENTLNGLWNAIWVTNLSVIQASDKRLKENIYPLNLGLKTILSLNPYSFKYKSDERGLHFGFIAQELKNTFPNSIVQGAETDSTYLGVIYSEFIPILTKAIQEQQVIIDKQKFNIDSIRTTLDLLFNSNLIKGNKSIETQKENLNKLPLLFQNHPNPFTGVTFIDYFLPINTTNAFLKVVDSNGKLVKAFPINQIGYGQVELDCSNLAMGTYFYSLLVNSNLIDTKSMMIANTFKY